MKLCKDCKYYHNVAMFHYCLREPSFEKIDLVTGKVQVIQPKLDCRYERGGMNWETGGKDSCGETGGKDSCGEAGMYFTPR